MLKWIDSHCHLNYPELSGNLQETIAAAHRAGVMGMLTICTEIEQAESILQIANHHQNIWASVGVHPHEAESTTKQHDADEVYEFLIQSANQSKVVGYGETGLDYYYEHSPRQEQIDLFHAHCKAASQMDIPLIVHTRDAEEDTIRILRDYEGQIRGVIHCFTGTAKLAQAALDLGFYISISGIITFKKSEELREIVRTIPLKRLLLETDAPYLAPEPYRGQANQPAYMVKTAEKVAEIKAISLEELSQITTKNFFDLFSRAGYV